jgi:hypothetical protein
VYKRQEYIWTIEGEDFSGPDVTYQFNKEGIYAITLKVVDIDGNEGYDELIVTVRGESLLMTLIVAGSILLIVSIGIASYLIIRKGRIVSTNEKTISLQDNDNDHR